MDRFAKLVVGGLLLVGGGSAGAVDWSSQFLNDKASRVINQTRGPVSVGSPFGSMTINSGTGGALISVQQPVKVGTSGVNLTLQRALTAGNIARVARVAARVSGPLAVASLVLDGLQYVDGQWMRPASDNPAPVDGMVWTHTRGNPSTCQTNAQACSYSDALREGMQSYCRANPSGYIDCAVTGTTVITNQSNLFNMQVSGQYVYKPTGQVVPVGFNVVGITSEDAPDDSAKVPASDAYMDTSIENALKTPAQWGKAAGVLELARSISRDADSTVGEVAGPTQSTGPSSVSGPSQTTQVQTSSGTETTVTNTTNNLTYNNNTVTVTETTTITHSDGSVTVINTAGGDGTPETANELSLCEKYPDIVACQKLGDLKAEPIERKTVALAMSAEAGFGPVGAQCPADVTFMWQGKELAMSWLPICTFATGIRPIVLAVAWLSAALGFFAFARKGD